MKAKTYHLTEVPPSLNNAYRNANYGGRHGRFKSNEYRSWINAAGYELKAQRISKIEGPFGVEIEIGRDMSRADLDNLAKPLVDLLVKMNAVPDDRNLMQLSMRFTARTNLRIRVFEIAAMPAATVGEAA